MTLSSYSFRGFTITKSYNRFYVECRDTSNPCFETYEQARIFIMGIESAFSMLIKANYLFAQSTIDSITKN